MKYLTTAMLLFMTSPSVVAFTTGTYNYPILSPEQANSFSYGLEQGARMRREQVQARAIEERNQFAGEIAKAELDKARLENQLLRQKLERRQRVSRSSRRPA